MTEWTYSYLLL